MINDDEKIENWKIESLTYVQFHLFDICESLTMQTNFSSISQRAKFDYKRSGEGLFELRKSFESKHT